MAKSRFLILSVFLVVPFAEAPQSPAQNARQNPWIATWAASPQPVDPSQNELPLKIEDQTVRERVRVSIAGTRIRIRLSNECGTTPLAIGAVTVATPNAPLSVKPGSIRETTFGGKKSVTIPAGAPVLSDPVDFSVAHGAEISISLYFPKRVTTPTWHELALKSAVISTRGDHTSDEKIEGGTDIGSWVSISAVLVPSQPSRQLVVAFGDSITDGDGSTMEADRNWPSDLVRRLGRTTDGSKVALVNEGIVASRLLSDCFLARVGCLNVSALARFDRDALGLPGVTHIVLLYGNNDIGFPGAKLNDVLLADPTDVRLTEDLIGAYRQLIARAHARGVKLIGATLTPFEGVDIPGYYSDAKEATGQAVSRLPQSRGLTKRRRSQLQINYEAVIRGLNGSNDKVAYRENEHPRQGDDYSCHVVPDCEVRWSPVPPDQDSTQRKRDGD